MPHPQAPFLPGERERSTAAAGHVLALSWRASVPLSPFLSPVTINCDAANLPLLVLLSLLVLVCAGVPSLPRRSCRAAAGSPPPAPARQAQQAGRRRLEVLGARRRSLPLRWLAMPRREPAPLGRPSWLAGGAGRGSGWRPSRRGPQLHGPSFLGRRVCLRTCCASSRRRSCARCLMTCDRCRQAPLELHLVRRHSLPAPSQVCGGRGRVMAAVVVVPMFCAQVAWGDIAVWGHSCWRRACMA
jgi:hypothetical protein